MTNPETIHQSVLEALKNSEPIPGVGITHVYGFGKDGITHHVMQYPETRDVDGNPVPGRLEAREGSLQIVEDASHLDDSIEWKSTGPDGRIKE